MQSYRWLHASFLGWSNEIRGEDIRIVGSRRRWVPTGVLKLKAGTESASPVFVESAESTARDNLWLRCKDTLFLIPANFLKNIFRGAFWIITVIYFSVIIYTFTTAEKFLCLPSGFGTSLSLLSETAYHATGKSPLG